MSSVPLRDVIVIGGSAGAVESLLKVVSGLPAHFPASVLVALHVPPWHRSELPSILTRAGHLRAEHPAHLQPLEHGRIYVAPPDHHLIVDDGRAYVWRGPKENQHRPAINALFRSAAVTGGGRVIGIVLSGALEDGATGLWWVKRHGGVAVIQDPADARFPDMPSAALATVQADYVLPSAAIPDLLVRLVASAGEPPTESATVR